MGRPFWFLDPGGWSKTAAVSLYFIFPGICTLSLLLAARSDGNQSYPKWLKNHSKVSLKKKRKESQVTMVGSEGVVREDQYEQHLSYDSYDSICNTTQGGEQHSKKVFASCWADVNTMIMYSSVSRTVIYI
ncbi:hypothetical protein STEG23_023716, partial [Scotinomys teguina]